MAAITGLVIGTATTVASFAQASKQNRLGKVAAQKAAEATVEAKKRLDVTFADKLSIQKDPFKMAMESVNSAAAQAIEASRESERGVAATAGRAVMAVGDNTRNVAGQMSQEMARLDVLSAQEKAANRNTAVGINIAEATGANKEAQNRQQMANQALMQGAQGVANVVSQAGKVIPLYSKNKTPDKIISAFGTEENAVSALNKIGIKSSLETLRSDLAKMNTYQQNKFKSMAADFAAASASDIYKAIPGSIGNANNMSADYEGASLWENPFDFSKISIPKTK